MPEFIPSPYQARIFEWVERGRGDGIVNAVAGSGKTVTLVQAARRLKSRSGIFVAFNKHIADELNTKLTGGMQARTVHSVGYGMLASHLRGRLQVENNKYRDLAKAHLTENPLPYGAGVGAREGLGRDERARLTATALYKLTNMARLTLTDPESAPALQQMCLHYDIDLPDGYMLRALPEILKAGKRLAEVGKIIDFTDMIWLPVIWGLAPKKVEWVFVDECQDLNACQLELVLRLRARGGRMLFVGDPRQSIMGFAGADSESFYKIQQRTDAESLPLSICYRCPSSHLNLARAIVPQIEARPDAPAGEIRFEKRQLGGLVQEGDLVLCRVTAPLIRECILLIQQRVPARVRGRDIGRDLCRLLERVEKMDGFTYEQIATYLTRHKQSQIEFLIQKGADESQIESLIDRIECLLVCAQSFDNAKSVQDLCSEIEGLFSDERASVWLSTVHRAKGLENDRVVLLEPKKLPLVWPNQQPWQYEQERNLLYVALTRAKQELVILGDEESLDLTPVPATGTQGQLELGTHGS